MRCRCTARRGPLLTRSPEQSAVMGLSAAESLQALLLVGVPIFLLGLLAWTRDVFDRPGAPDRLFRIYYKRERNRLAQARDREQLNAIRAKAVRQARDEARPRD